jgi:hypothetical protein
MVFTTSTSNNLSYSFVAKLEYHKKCMWTCGQLLLALTYFGTKNSDILQLQLGNRPFELFISIEILTHFVYPLVCINPYPANVENRVS